MKPFLALFDKNPIHNYAREGDLKRLKAFVASRAPREIRLLVSHPFPTRGIIRTTPLAIACKNGHFQVVEYLVTHCKADIEQRSSIEFENEIIEEARPLWCAAAGGHYEIVKFLTSKGADVDFFTKTFSTPLRAACYGGKLEIVKCLVENGSNIEIPNKHGHTCLMIACFRSHYPIVKYLLEKGALVNRRNVKGNTALHDCAEAGSVEILRLLMNHGARVEKDYYGITPIMCAALWGHLHFVNAMISEYSVCDQEEIANALELLGATYVDKKRNIMRAVFLWKRAMRIRNEYGIVKKINTQQIEAYNYILEFTTLEELEDLSSDTDALKMQALLIRERILGPAHPSTSYFIRHRGATYADSNDFERCLLLWFYALDMQQKYLKPFSLLTQASFIALADVFFFMMVKSPHLVKFSDLFAVYQRALCELQSAILKFKPKTLGVGSNPMIFQQTLKILINILGLLCKFQPCLTPSQESELEKATQHLVKLSPRTKTNWTLLHVVAGCYKDYISSLTSYPSNGCIAKSIVELLIKMGASPTEEDDKMNTPLHVLCSRKNCSKEVFEILLDNGAHIDYRNSKGDTPLSLLECNSPNVYLEIRSLNYISLQCLAARVIRRNKIDYCDFIPQHLIHFVSRH